MIDSGCTQSTGQVRGLSQGFLGVGHHVCLAASDTWKALTVSWI